MKILHLCTGLGPGGKERQLVELLRYLSASGSYKNTLVIFKNEIHYSEVFGLDLELIILDKNKFSILKIMKFLLAIGKSHSFDIVHSWDHYSAHLASYLYMILRIKHVNYAIQYGKKNNYFSLKGLTLLISFLSSNIIIANSNAGFKNIKYFRRKAVIRNGFDFERIKDMVKLAGDSPKLTVGMVANFHSAKDQLSLVKAGIQILRNLHDVEFLFVGDGPTHRDVQMSIPAEYLRNFKFLGHQDNIERIVSQFDIGCLICNTNGHAEGISNSIMEYMACKLPVVATDSGGNQELIIHEVTGYLVQPFAIDEITNRLITLLGNPELRREMGLKGFDHLASNFSMKLYHQSFDAVYKKICT